jgi:hypothetical protein
MLLIVQILGGLFGFGVAYVMYRLVELPYERSTAAARVKYLAEMEELRKKKEAARKTIKKGAVQ